MAVDTPNNDIQDKKLQDISENPVNKNILWVDNWTVDKLSNTLEFDMEDEERELLTTILQIWKNNIHLEDWEYNEGQEWESKKIDELLNILSNRNNHENDIPFDTKFDLINTIFTTLYNHLNTVYIKNRKGLKCAIEEYMEKYYFEYEENEDFDEVMNSLMKKVQYSERLENVNYMGDEEKGLLTTILQIWKNNIHLEDEEYYEGREWESKKIDELLNILSKRNNHENDIPFDTKFDLINTIFTTLNNHLNTTYFKIKEGNRKGLKGAIVEYIDTYCTEYEENDDFEEIKYMLMQKIKYGEWLQEIHSEF